MNDKEVKAQRKHTINMYLSNKIVSNYMKQKPIELKEEMGKSTNKLENFNRSLSGTNKTSRQKIIMVTQDWNNTVHQYDHTYIYTFFPSIAEYTFFQVRTKRGARYPVLKSLALLLTIWVFKIASALNLLHMLFRLKINSTHRVRKG